MHPIERLRFVARAQGVPDEVLAIEAAQALTVFADDPAGMTAACRRVLARQAGCGPLWWVCARLLTADDVHRAARESVDALETDTTRAEASLALAAIGTGGPSAVLVSVGAFGGGGALVRADDLDLLDAPQHRGDVPGAAGADASQVWLVGGVGRHLPEPLWRTAVDHLAGEGGSNLRPVELARFTHVIGAEGKVPLAALGPADCPVVPELLRLAG